MRWQQSRRSGNVIDTRGRGGGGGGGGFGGFGGFPGGGRGVRLGCGPLLILVVLALVFKINPLSILGGGGGTAPGPVEGGAPPADDPEADFAARILGDTEDAWGEIFSRTKGQQYPAPQLVLYSDAVQSACGTNTSAAGPFYCPTDQRLYLDLTFFRELQGMGAPGDFASAYVIAHEVGHHIQNLEGTLQRTQDMQRRASSTDANQISVATELQADCYAGVWGHSAAQRGLLEQGDVEEGLGAAAAVGDDALQRAAQGYVVPDAFTHGSSEQRSMWFRRGLDSGDPASCNTFQ